MKVYCLASSSSGNCYIMDFEINGNHTLLMVECGIPYATILQKCTEFKLDFSNINNCLITHAHSDHSKSAKDLAKRGIEIWAHKDTLDIINLKGNELPVNERKNIENGLVVYSFAVEHDIDGAIGFIIKTPTETVLFVNDCKYWKTNLINFKPDYVFIECNYWQNMVYAQVHQLKEEVRTCEMDELDLKEHNVMIKAHERNINSHMSLRGTIRNLKTLNLSKCKAIFLMHLSDRFANEFVMKNEVQQATGIKTYACKKYGSIK